MVNFYHRFIPGAVHLMLPLFDSLAGKPKFLTWCEAMGKAFVATKKALAEAAVLTHHYHGVPLSLTTDASHHAVGAVLRIRIVSAKRDLKHVHQRHPSTHISLDHPFWNSYGFMTSDRGAQCTSQLWTSIAQLLGIELHLTTAYHPQSNGLVERFRRHLRASLRARLTVPNWTTELPWVLLGICTAPKDDLGCSSAELDYSVPVTVRGDFFC